MSSVLYGSAAIAPWPIGFEKRTVQYAPLEALSSSQRRATVPDGQWWRIVAIQAGLNLSAVVGTRQMRLNIQTENGIGPGIDIDAAGTATANGVYKTLWGPDLSAYTQAGLTNEISSVQAIPDIVWPPKTTIVLQEIGFQAGDGWHAVTSILVEVYVPVRPSLLPAIATPLPV